MHDRVRHEGDRVWIEGVTGWSSRDRQSSVHAAQAAVMRSVGEATTYDHLLGVSGLAFRMQISREGLCPSSPHSCCGYKCLSGSVRALPWSIRVLDFGPGGDESEGKKREARAAVVESIDRGVAVEYGSEEDGIVVGYQKGGLEWICCHPLNGEGKPVVVTEWPWAFTIFTGPKQIIPSRRELATAALEQIVAMSDAGAHDGYFVGIEAWAQYITRLRALEGWGDVVQPPLVLGNAWIYECLAGYRASAARYLEEIGGEFAPPISSRLANAAGLWEKMSTRVLDDPGQGTASIAPYPWMLKSGWTEEMRRDQVRRLEEALALERQAVGEVREALALIARSSAGRNERH